MVIRPANDYGGEWRPARSSRIHCTRCGIVFAEPAPPLDYSGQRICNYCKESEKQRYTALLENPLLNPGVNHNG